MLFTTPFVRFAFLVLPFLAYVACGGSGGGNNLPINFNAGLGGQGQGAALSLSTSSLNASATALAADGIALSTIQITLLDTQGNPLAGQSVTLAASGSSNTIDQPTSLTDQNGQTTGSIRSTFAEQKTISAIVTLGTTAQTLDQKLNIQFLPVASAATQLHFSAQPSGANINTFINPAPEVQIRDASNTLVTSASYTVSLAIQSGPTGAALGGITSIQSLNGVARFSNLKLDQPGNYVLTASSPNLTNALSTSFTITAFNGPILQAFYPNLLREGISIAISGQGFDSTPSGNIVDFNGVSGSVLSASSTELILQVPQGISDGNLSIEVAGVKSNNLAYKIGPQFINIDGNGTQATDISEYPGISDNGRYVVFESIAGNLTPNDLNFETDIFVRDLETGSIERVSVTSSGAMADDKSKQGRISGDGRYVVFQSTARNLVANDNNNVADIFVHDRLTKETKRVSVASDGTEGNKRSINPDISADGRYIVYGSEATNLVPNDTNKNGDVFLYDQFTAITKRISVDANGNQATFGPSYLPDISADGRYIVFSSGARDLVPNDTNSASDIFLHDTLDGSMTRISVDANGNQANMQSGESRISADGRYVVFASNASNLVPGDTNLTTDVFLYDHQTGSIERVSVNTNGDQTDQNESFLADISNDGRYITFLSGATNLSTADTNGTVFDVFLRDTLLNTTTLVSVNSTGAAGNGEVLWADMAGNGLSVVIETEADNMVPGDSNSIKDLIVTPLGSDACPTPNLSTISQPSLITGMQIVLRGYHFDSQAQNNIVLFGGIPGQVVSATSSSLEVTVPAGIKAGNITVEVAGKKSNSLAYKLGAERVNLTSNAQESSFAVENDFSLSGDGRYALFVSSATDLDPAATSGRKQVYLRDNLLGSLQLVSVNSAGVESDADAEFCSISTDGQYVVFISKATNLGPGASGTYQQIYRWKRLGGNLELVSLDPGTGAEAKGDCYTPSISGNGHVVAFASDARNLIANDNNNAADIFVHDLLANKLERISLDSNAVEANAASSRPAIDLSGRYVAFESLASNLVTNDSNGVQDIFVRDRLLAQTSRISLDSNGLEADLASYAPSITHGGRYIAFESEATNLVANDQNGLKDIFLHNHTTGQTQRISVDFQTQGDLQQASFAPSISSNGQALIFSSLSGALVAQDTNGAEDVFVYELASGSISLVSLKTSGDQINGIGQTKPALSADGMFVLFSSADGSISASDNNGVVDLFLGTTFLKP